MTDCRVSNKIVCERELTSDSNITSSTIVTDRVLNYLRVDYSFLSKLTDTNTFGHFEQFTTTSTIEFDYSSTTTLFLTGLKRAGTSSYPSLKMNLHFKVIHNLIGDNHSYYTGLSADRWIE